MSSTLISHSHLPTGSPEPPINARAGRASRWFERRWVHYRDASMELVLVPGGRLRRFVELHSEKLRVVLGQPERREIEPLLAEQEHFHLRTSELWALADRQARDSLRLLYTCLAEKNKALKPAAQTSHPTPAPALGHVLAPQPIEASARGQLLFAGATHDGRFCVELLEDNRRVRSIVGLDLARALEVAQVKSGDMILIERDGRHEIAIHEERSGSHGEGRRTLRRARETFRITNESPPEVTSDAARPLRSSHSTSSAA